MKQIVYTSWNKNSIFLFEINELLRQWRSQSAPSDFSLGCFNAQGRVLSSIRILRFNAILLLGLTYNRAFIVREKYANAGRCRYRMPRANFCNFILRFSALQVNTRIIDTQPRCYQTRMISSSDKTFRSSARKLFLNETIRRRPPKELVASSMYLFIR